MGQKMLQVQKEMWPEKKMGPSTQFFSRFTMID